MKTLVGIAFLILALTVSGYAADNSAHAVTMAVNEVCVIDLNSTSGISLATGTPAVGGALPTSATDSSKRLSYTSVVASGGARRITANWRSSDHTPAGTSLLLDVSGVPAAGGTAAGPIRLSDEPQNIITDIRSFSTGSHEVELNYTFAVEDVNSLIRGETSTVVVNFTLTDA